MNRLLTKMNTSFKQLLLLMFLMGIPLAGYSCIISYPNYLWGIELYEGNRRIQKVTPNYDFIFSDTDVNNIQELYGSVVLWYNDLPVQIHNNQETLYLDILIGDNENEEYYKRIESLKKLIEKKLDGRISIITQVVQFNKDMPVSMNKVILAGLESYLTLSSDRIVKLSLEEILTFRERHPIPKVFGQASLLLDGYYYDSYWHYGNHITDGDKELSYNTKTKRKRTPPIAPHTEIRSLFLYETQDDKDDDSVIV